MKQLFHLILPLLICFTLKSKAQSPYFPPLSGTTWDTLSPDSLGWCQSNIESLYSYLEQTHTAGFIVLKNGKIVLEKYFGTFTADSVHYWASAGKSMTAVLVGIAKEKGQVQINNPVTNYLGAGWSADPVAKESVINLRHLLTMTSGFDDSPPSPCDNQSTTPNCLIYLTDTSLRWAYHTGAYQQLLGVISAAANTNINAYTTTNLGNHIGMTGLWVNGVFYSKPRSMARFGLLAMNQFKWGTDTLLHDTSFIHNMLNTSQPYNQSYGYLWWLNGKSSFMGPGLQYVFQNALIPHGPPDMYCALGKNDQKIYVAPSQRLVVVRVGESAYGVADAFSPFDDLLWRKIDSLSYGCQYTFTGNGNWTNKANWKESSIPPQVLDKNGTITITPATGGVCNLNTPQTITQGSNLILPPGVIFNILGNLQIYQH